TIDQDFAANVSSDPAWAPVAAVRALRAPLAETAVRLGRFPPDGEPVDRPVVACESPAHPDRGAARRRLSPLHRYPCAHRGAGPDPAWNSHGRHRHPVLHLAAGRHATDLVMSLAGRDLTIGYSDRVATRGAGAAWGSAGDRVSQ